MTFNVSDYLDELCPLVNIDCGTYSVEGIKTVAGIMAQKYQALGWSVKQVDCGKAGMGLEVRNKPQAETIDLMMVGHLDTVFPDGTVSERPMTTDATRAYGPGVADMKSGLLSTVWALRSLPAETLDQLSICICMNPDEEVGSLDSAPWLSQVAQQSRQVLVAEAARANGDLVKARKGMARYRLTFSGVAAHAGNNPQDGRSAISELAHWVLAINELTDFDIGTTFNVGVIKGGNGANIVPDHAEAVVDVRFWDNEHFARCAGQLDARLATPFTDGVSVSMVREAHKPSMVPSADTEALMALVEQAADELGLPIGWQAVGGGSDANLTASLGIPTLDGLGPIGGAMHGPDEYLVLDSIGPRIRLLARVIEKLANAA